MSQQAYTIELVGPVLPDSSWQAQSPDAWISLTLKSIGSNSRLAVPKATSVPVGKASLDRKGQETMKIPCRIGSVNVVRSRLNVLVLKRRDVH